MASNIVKGIFISADMEQPIKVVEFDRSDYTNIQKFVGGLFQVLDIPNASIWINEEGKLIGLPFNLRASNLLYLYRSEFIGNDALVGDALVLGQADNEGNTLSVPDKFVDLLLNPNKV